ncbi:hypothetical protein BC835DRAFT_480454 [Cytidiella melzeri]|nr:hypothetical protein BC835DRAFT_480454 [Cytidiella melzeri]
MASNCPEEILCDILKHAFHVSIVDNFIEDRSLYKPRLHRPSHLLLVCKQWLRIATPFLYETVEVSSEKEMEKLGAVLRSHSALGRMIRHLRLNGGYGQHLYPLAKLAPKVRVLGVYVSVQSKESNARLVRALACWKPTELYLHGLSYSLDRHGERNNKNSTTKVVLDCVRTSKSLKLVAFVDASYSWMMAPELHAILEQAPALSEVGMSSIELKRLLVETRFIEVLRKAEIRVIRCYGMDGELDKVLGRVPEDVKQLVVYESTEWMQRWYKTLAARVVAPAREIATESDSSKCVYDE